MCPATGSRGRSRMKRQRAVVIAASSDIGAYLARRFAAQGWEVAGTYRERSAATNELEALGVGLYRLDVASQADSARFAAALGQKRFRWDVLISAAGLLSPIGR